MPIELELEEKKLDALADATEARAEIIRACGAKPIGERPMTDGGFTLCEFSDPITKERFFLEPSSVTADAVREKLSVARRKFGMAMIDIALGKDISLVEKLQWILRFLTETDDLPEEKLRQAAHAALNIISEEKETHTITQS